MPTPEKTPWKQHKEDAQALNDHQREILRALSQDCGHFPFDSHPLGELRLLRAEVAELRRALIPGSSPLILGAQAASEYRRLINRPTKDSA